MEGWKIVHTRTVEWDDERCALALRLEEERIRTLLNHVAFSLHNVNRCIDPNEQRRLWRYMKRWREARGQGGPPGTSYMATVVLVHAVVRYNHATEMHGSQFHSRQRLLRRLVAKFYVIVPLS